MYQTTLELIDYAEVWDIAGGFCTHNLKGHQNAVRLVAFHATQLVVASAAEDFEIRLWALKTSVCTGPAD